jgi:hypothetical protein
MRYSCDPPWWIIILNSATAIAVLLLLAVGWISYPVGVVVVTLLTFLVLLLAIRRAAFRRYVELADDALLLPTGFLQMHTARIPYGTIDRVWESRWALGTVLNLQANHKKFEITCGIRLDRDAYVSVRNFLIQATSRNNERGSAVA